MRADFEILWNDAKILYGFFTAKSQIQLFHGENSNTTGNLNKPTKYLENLKKNPKKRPKVMSNSNRIIVLSAFSPYLHLLKAFNADNFHQKDWRAMLHSIFDAFISIMIIFLIPTYCVLDFWNLIDIGAEMSKIVVAFPLIISGFQFVLIYIALVLANRTISETIDRLQEAIDRRKYLFCSSIQKNKNNS